MDRALIRQGETYRNRDGRAHRQVVAVSKNFVTWRPLRDQDLPVAEPKQYRSTLPQFAKWARGVVGGEGTETGTAAGAVQGQQEAEQA